MSNNNNINNKINYSVTQLRETTTIQFLLVYVYDAKSTLSTWQNNIVCNSLKKIVRVARFTRQSLSEDSYALANWWHVLPTPRPANHRQGHAYGGWPLRWAQVAGRCQLLLPVVVLLNPIMQVSSQKRGSCRILTVPLTFLLICRKTRTRLSVRKNIFVLYTRTKNINELRR